MPLPALKGATATLRLGVTPERKATPMTRAEHAPSPVAHAALDDLRTRLRAYRRVDVPPGFGWTRGVQGDYLVDLLAQWADSYDWREHEARIRDLPWVLTGEGGTPLRLIDLHPADAGADADTVPDIDIDIDADTVPVGCCTGGPTPSCGSRRFCPCCRSCT